MIKVGFFSSSTFHCIPAYMSGWIWVCPSALTSPHFTSLLLTPPNPKARFSPSSSIRPSIHPPISNETEGPVSACNFSNDHTFVFVPVMKHCSSPWPPWRSGFVVRNVLRLSVEIWRSEKQNLCVWGVSERNPPPLYLGHMHLSGWLASLSV